MTESAGLENKAFRVILLGIEDVVGKNGLETILRNAQLPQYINNYPPIDEKRGGHKLEYQTQVNRALYDIYGARGARAILQRVGRGRAKNAIDENGAIASAVRFATRLLPRRTKAKLALDTVSKEYSKQLETVITIEEDGEFIYWQDSNCGNCIGWQSETPICFSGVGFLQGLLSWLLEDENFKVEEIACHAMGAAACRHRIKV